MKIRINFGIFLKKFKKILDFFILIYIIKYRGFDYDDID